MPYTQAINQYIPHFKIDSLFIVIRVNDRKSIQIHALLRGTEHVAVILDDVGRYCTNHCYAARHPQGGKNAGHTCTLVSNCPISNAIHCLGRDFRMQGIPTEV